MTIRLLNINREDVGKLTDEELVTKFSKSGKDAYFEELYNRYQHLVYGLCLKMMKDDSDSNDIRSEVFRILYQKLPTANILSFRSYIYAVARNECIAILRKRKSEAQKQANWNYSENAGNEFMENDALSSLMDRTSDIEKAVEKAVEGLGPDQHTCIHLFFYQDKSYKEIAEETGFSEKQVKSYLQNGKRNLKIALEDELKKHYS